MLLAIRVLAVAAIVALVVLSWIPRELEVRTGLPGQFEHTMAYAGASALAALSIRSGRRRGLGLWLVALAGILELGQIWVPGRSSQLIDFAASGAGVPIGICIADIVAEPLLRRLFGTHAEREADLPAP